MEIERKFIGGSEHGVVKSLDSSLFYFKQYPPNGLQDVQIYKLKKFQRGAFERVYFVLEGFPESEAFDFVKQDWQL